MGLLTIMINISILVVLKQIFISKKKMNKNTSTSTVMFNIFAVVYYKKVNTKKYIKSGKFPSSHFSATLLKLFDFLRNIVFLFVCKKCFTRRKGKSRFSLCTNICFSFVLRKQVFNLSLVL